MTRYTQITATQQQRAAQAPSFASILIVDDQRFDRMRLSKMCRNFDFNTQVVEATSLEEMHDKLNKERFDLILLDYHLTDGTGLEGVETVRADPVNNAAAIVMITGTEQKDISLQALKMGFSDYITKDELSDETLSRAAITALQKSQLARGMSVRENRGAPPIVVADATLQSFSRECAQDIKPIVSRLMRQMRGLRELDRIDPEEAAERVDRVEGSLRRLWSFLDNLDQIGSPVDEIAGPSVSGIHGAARVNARVPSVRPAKNDPKSRKPPSIFRRRPD